MSIFSKLASKIFGHEEKTPIVPPTAPTVTPGVPAAAPVAVAPAVDIETILEGLAAKTPQKLNWRTSIVDLMKLVGMESSLTERKELAKELGYTGSTQDTATLNIWLHKQVMKKLAETGGKVPADLLR